MGGQHGSRAEVSDGAGVEVPVSLGNESTGSGLGPVPWLRYELRLTVLHIPANKADGRSIEQYMINNNVFKQQ